MTEWKPIETVPTMTDVLLWDGNRQNVGYCDNTNSDGYYEKPILACSNVNGWYLDQPTHWMPLPKAPK